MKFKWAAMATAVLVIAANAAPPANYDTYCNARYGYCIAYPRDLLVPQPVAGNGDGRVFLARRGGGEFRVYASHIMDLEGLDDSPKSMVDFAAKDCPGGRPSYVIAKPHLAAVSCETPKGIFYEKILIGNGIATTLWAIYPKEGKAIWDRVVTEMARSMQPSTGD